MDIINTLKNKFRSGNSVPVPRAAITREEYEQLMILLHRCQTYAYLLCISVEDLGLKTKESKEILDMADKFSKIELLDK